MSRRSVKEFSFGYSVPPGGQRRAEDGANELLEIELVEVGPTLKGMNPDTELHSVKATDIDASPLERDIEFDPEHAAIRDRTRDEFYELLTAPTDGNSAKSTRRRVSLHERELRRQCDRVRLEASLGFDQDLIDRLRG